MSVQQVSQVNFLGLVISQISVLREIIRIDQDNILVGKQLAEHAFFAGGGGTALVCHLWGN
jgi:hypothetical protein